MLKKCKCGNEFEQYRTTQKACIPCLIIISKKKIEKQEKKEWGIRKAALKKKYGLETLTKVMNDLQKTINHIARLIDKDLPCISCFGKPLYNEGIGIGKVDHGGHYYPSGNNKTITFHLDNIHGQCIQCNDNLSGNLIEYRIGLINRYGIKYVEKIESLRLKYKRIRHSIVSIKETHTKAYKVLKELQRNNEAYTKLERIELREQYNKEIGIYIED